MAAAASTGTAIGTIYGVAASNAGWAWFGGGSLATGGGGMALGHLILPGVGVLVGVGTSAFLAHKKANELNVVTKQLAEVNSKNRDTLCRVTANARDLERAERQFDLARDDLFDAIQSASRTLARFGWVSFVSRRIRYFFGFAYYTGEELLVVSDLDKAVKTFMASFGPESQ
ncbi:MAG: hypothetical protein WCA44_04040 [Acidobacteriaceae bacterium]